MREVYLDHAATTPVLPEVFEAMKPFLGGKYGNPSSFHTKGKEAKDAIEEARGRVASHLGARPDEILFTSGGTESDNLAILGYARANKSSGTHLVATAIEHPAVLEALTHLEKKEGFSVTLVPVDRGGKVDPKDIAATLRPETILVSVIYANNEIGTIQPIAEIGMIVQRWRKEHPGSAIVFHSDACQASGALPLDVGKLHADLLSINSSKIYGPKAVGALYLRRGLKITPLQFGGSQEKGLRAGTENVAGIIGFAKALDIAQEERVEETIRLLPLRDRLIERILSTIPKTRLNGDSVARLPNNVDISFMDIKGEALVLYLDAAGVYVSTGSACTSASLDPSHVILALGVPFEVAHSSIRFSLGRATTEKDLEYVMEVLPPLVEKLRKISPVCVADKYWKGDA